MQADGVEGVGLLEAHDLIDLVLQGLHGFARRHRNRENQPRGVAPALLDAGIGELYVVNRDTRGAITKAAAHYIVYIGTNPGSGNISGSVYDGSMGNAALSGVTLTINRGMFSQSTASNGTYTFSNTLPAGTWEITASKTGYISQTVTVTVAAAGSVNQNFTLLRAP